MDLREASLNNFRVINRHPWEMARVEVVFDLLKKIIPDNLSEFTILDIGCGEPFVINCLTERFKGAKAYAIDRAFSPLLIEKYQTEFSSCNRISFFDSVSSFQQSHSGQTVDVVLLLDVLEHVEDDRSFLAKIINIKEITSNTLFLITVPAFQRLFSGHDLFLGHYRRYSNKELKTFAESVGLRVLSVGYFFLILLLLRSFQKIKELLFGQKSQFGVGIWHSKSFFDKLLIRLLIIDYNLFNKFNCLGLKWPGLSNFMICKKRV